MNTQAKNKTAIVNGFWVQVAALVGVGVVLVVLAAKYIW